MIGFLAATPSPAPAGEGWLTILIVTVGGAIPGVAAWWRANRVAKEREAGTVWDQAQDFYKDAMQRQEKENVELRARVRLCDADLGRAARRVDQLIGFLDMHGVTVPPHLLTRPWEHDSNGDGNGAAAAPKPP